MARTRPLVLHFFTSTSRWLRTNVSSRRSISTPGIRSVGRVLPTQSAWPPSSSFRAVRTDSGYEWRPLEFVDCSDDPDAAATAGWFTKQSQLLNELAYALDQEGALDAIGVSLTHGREEIPCEPDEVLVEDTDELTRTLTMRPRKLDSLKGSHNADELGRRRRPSPDAVHVSARPPRVTHAFRNELEISSDAQARPLKRRSLIT